MDAIGINIPFLFVQAGVVILFIGLPVLSLTHLAKQKMSRSSQAWWVLIICIFPVLGVAAYWIVKPAGENKT